jgi:hypothetical protein
MAGAHSGCDISVLESETVREWLVDPMMEQEFGTRRTERLPLDH